MFEHRLSDGSHLRHGSVNVRILLEEDLDYSDAVIRLRLNVLDIVDSSGHASLAQRNQAFFHFFWRQACVAPYHAYDRDVDIGENVNGSTHDGYHTENQNQYGRHYERIGAVERESYEPHHAAFLARKELRISSAVVTQILALVEIRSVT